MSTSLFHLFYVSQKRLVYDKYRIIKKVGGGSFGDIYLGIQVSQGENYGVKQSIFPRQKMKLRKCDDEGEIFDPNSQTYSQHWENSEHWKSILEDTSTCTESDCGQKNVS